MTRSFREVPKVLVCDDDFHCRSALVDMLSGGGFATCEAGGVLEALRVARACRVDFGFFDYQLPDGDGMTAVKCLAQASIRFPWVLMSGEETIEERSVAAAGAVAFLPKPLDVVEVRRILKECFGFPR